MTIVMEATLIRAQVYHFPQRHSLTLLCLRVPLQEVLCNASEREAKQGLGPKKGDPQGRACQCQRCSAHLQGMHHSPLAACDKTEASAPCCMFSSA